MPDPRNQLNSNARQQALAAFYAHRAASLQNGNQGYVQNPAQDQSTLGRIISMIPIHPATLLNWVQQRINGAQQ